MKWRFLLAIAKLGPEVSFLDRINSVSHLKISGAKTVQGFTGPMRFLLQPLSGVNGVVCVDILSI